MVGDRPGLADLGSRPSIRRLPDTGKRRMSPTAARNVAATITLTPGTVISLRTSGHASASRAITRSTSAISASRNAMWRSPASTVSRSSTGSCCSASQVRPLMPNRSLAGGRPFSRRISTAWISFLARVHAADAAGGAEPAGDASRGCARRAPRPRPATRPPAAWPARAHRGDRSSRAPDGSRCRSGLTTITPSDMRLEDPRDFPRVAGDLQRHAIIGRQALREQLQVLKLPRDATPRPAPADMVEDRDLAEVAMHIHSDRPHHSSLRVA